VYVCVCVCNDSGMCKDGVCQKRRGDGDSEKGRDRGGGGRGEERGNISSV
jgi:hypothetical protein